MTKRLSKPLPTTDQQVTSTIHAALEQGESRPGRIRGSRPGVGGARLAPLSPSSTCIDGVGHFSGLGAKHGHLARRAPSYVGPVLRFHAAYRRTDPVSSAIQNRLIVQ